MPTLHFQVESKLSLEAVLAALTDFSPSRAKVWPNIDSDHFKLHTQGPGWAEVTEGSSVAGGVWDRERSSCDAADGTVAVETLYSNTWGPGSSWDYRLTPGTSGATRIAVTAVRNGKGGKGKLSGVLLAAGGTGMIRAQLEHALAHTFPPGSGG